MNRSCKGNFQANPQSLETVRKSNDSRNQTPRRLRSSPDPGNPRAVYTACMVEENGLASRPAPMLDSPDDLAAGCLSTFSGPSRAPLRKGDRHRRGSGASPRFHTCS